MAEEASRPMKFPYTFSAKIAQFPFKFYYQHSWGFKWWLYACVVAAPVFWKLQKLSYSPENVRKWEAMNREDFYGGGHH